MSRAITAIFVAMVAMTFAVLSRAQDQPDIPLPPNSESGTYTMRIQIPNQPEDAEVTEACCVRADVSPVIELGCAPGSAGDLVTFDVEVIRTPGDNGELRCYTRDPDDVSDYSYNAYILDFTRPNTPTLH
jgi:hypothetical protein